MMMFDDGDGDDDGHDQGFVPQPACFSEILSFWKSPIFLAAALQELATSRIMRPNQGWPNPRMDSSVLFFRS